MSSDFCLTFKNIHTFEKYSLFENDFFKIKISLFMPAVCHPHLNLNSYQSCIHKISRILATSKSHNNDFKIMSLFAVTIVNSATQQLHKSVINAQQLIFFWFSFHTKTLKHTLLLYVTFPLVKSLICGCLFNSPY